MTLDNKKKLKFLYLSEPLSKLGEMAQGITLATFAYSSTDSPTLFGLFLFAKFIPEIILGPFSGYLADKFSRKYITVTVSLTLSFLSLVMIQAKENYLHMTTLIILYSTVQLLYRPAFASSIPNLVKEQDLPKVNRNFSVLQSISQILGASIATFGILNSQIIGVLIFNSITFIIAAITCYLSIPNNKALDKNFKEVNQQYSIIFSLKYIFKYNNIKNLVIGSTLLWGVLALSDTLLVPVLGESKIDGEQSYGIYRIISTIGMLIGGFLSLYWVQLFYKKKYQSLGFYIPVLLLSIFSIFLPLLLEKLWLGLFLYLAIWVCMELPTNLLHYEIQQVPDNIRGKIFSISDAIDGVLFSVITLCLPFLTMFTSSSILLGYSSVLFFIITLIIIIFIIHKSNKESI